jgi:hypothetical protein
MLKKFMLRPVKKSEMKINESTKKKWDLEEKKGFEFYSIRNKNYGVRKNLKNNLEVVYYLNFIDKFIQELIKCIKVNKKMVKKSNCVNECIIFVNTPYTLQEIPKGNVYNGINKPKNIHWKTKNCKIQTLLDNDLLATSRHIMLELRHTNGDVKTWGGKNGVKNLLLHELSHTMCNHITYRENGQYNEKFIYEPGNHEKQDFYKCEKFLKDISKITKCG